MTSRSNFDKHPAVQISRTGDECATGWREILDHLREHSGARRIAIECYPGALLDPLRRELVAPLVPPGWAHCVINADPNQRMTFGACCDRQYGFEYTGVRAHHGLAWFPTLTTLGDIHWQPNSHNRTSTIEQHEARAYPELGLDSSRSLYSQFADNPDSMMFVADPQRAANCWPTFLP